MIVKKKWFQQNRRGTREWYREGYFLFGFIPLYTRDETSRGRFGKKYF